MFTLCDHIAPEVAQTVLFQELSNSLLRDNVSLFTFSALYSGGTPHLFTHLKLAQHDGHITRTIVLKVLILGEIYMQLGKLQ